MKGICVRPVPLIFASLYFVPLITLTACGSHSVAPVPTTTLSVSPEPASIPFNSAVTFTATTNQPASSVSWLDNR